MSGLRLDLGCGATKKEGTIGLDVVPGPVVDQVLNFETDPLPFPDGSVEYVFSSHCLEHLPGPFPLFTEISRVCQEGAGLEFWTPYAWENSAFIFGHRTFYNEDHYLHACLWFADYWQKLLGKRWVLREIVYVIEPSVLAELFREQVNLDFALRYYKGIVREFGVMIDVWGNYPGPEIQPERRFAANREAERHPLPPIAYPPAEIPPDELAKATAWLSASSVERPLARREPVAPPGQRPRLALARHLASRFRVVAREEGLLAVARRTGGYLRGWVKPLF